MGFLKQFRQSKNYGKKHTKHKIEISGPSIIESDTLNENETNKNSNAKLMAYANNHNLINTGPISTINFSSDNNSNSPNSNSNRIPIIANIPHNLMPADDGPHLPSESPHLPPKTLKSHHNNISPSGNQSVDSGNSSGKITNLDTTSDSNPIIHDPTNNRKHEILHTHNTQPSVVKQEMKILSQNSVQNQSLYHNDAMLVGTYNTLNNKNIQHSRVENLNQTSNSQKLISQTNSQSSQNSQLSQHSSNSHQLNHTLNTFPHSAGANTFRTTKNQKYIRTNPINMPLANLDLNNSHSTNVTFETPNIELVKKLKDSWYRPNLSREEAINLLKTSPFGSFVIRDSTSYKGGYGMAIRIERLTEKILKNCSNKADLLSEHVRHYLIETVEMEEGTVGYLLKGSAQEKIFPSLDRLIYKHMINQVSLPIKLNLKLYYHTIAPQPDIASKTLRTQPPIENVDEAINNMKAQILNETKNKKLDNALQLTNSLNNSLISPGTTPSLNESRRPDPYSNLNKRTESLNSTISMNQSLMSTYPIYLCHLVYLGCRDCELLTGSAAVEKSISSLLNNENKQFKSSSLVELKLQRAGITLTDEVRKLFFRKHFNKRQLLACQTDPEGRTVNVTAYSGLQKGALLFGIVMKASGSQNQCHILAEVDASCSTDLIVEKINLFIQNQLV